jgi:hypothetical protein
MAPTFDVRTHLYRLTGVDLTRIDGINALIALKVVAETGLDMMPSIRRTLGSGSGRERHESAFAAVSRGSLRLILSGPGSSGHDRCRMADARSPAGGAGSCSTSTLSRHTSVRSKRRGFVSGTRWRLARGQADSDRRP